MRICHACQRELEKPSLEAGRCEHCGAVLRSIAQRTIDDTRFPAEPSAPAPKPGDTEESIDLEPIESIRPGATIEIARTDTTRSEPPQPPKDPPLASKPSESERRSPTIADRMDMTIDITAPVNLHFTEDPPVIEPMDPGEPEKKATRRSTHTLESDKTIDLGDSSDEAQKLDSQWRGTFDLGTKQGQTIRQRETVGSFRSSLPVKSRYIREKRKNGNAPSSPPKTLAEVPDYELLDIIGEGGMGVVYAAHQSSIARTVAVKMLKPSTKVRDEQRDKFISEAVVTGELDHPNIVPIYDLGANDQGALFYSMKRVKGTPWDKVIHKKQLDENLSILLRVADAVAFAHAGGVIHRDLKPENVMLGDYGEVLVMDWGLARVTPEFANADAVYQADSLGGTPAYMAPEMARGPVERIDKTSDVYLLGAILYEIIGNQPPHSGRDVMQCLMSASQNRIDPIRYDGELKEIALKAMATKQEDRYPTVKEFQAAVRVYQSHSESLVLTAHANQNLQKARAAGDYALFARALYGFQESLTLWDQNHRARGLLAETQRDYAQCALGKGDLDLAASLLDAKNPDHQKLRDQIEAGRAERDARLRRLRLAKMAVAALIATVIASVSTGLYLVSVQRNKAVLAREDAEKQRGIAVEQKTVAVEQKQIADEQRAVAVQQKQVADEKTVEAVQQRQIADEQRTVAVQQKQLAEQAKQAEEYEAYVARIGLAAAKINDNAFDYASELLTQGKPELRNWEWGRLARLCQLSTAVYPAAGPVNAVAYAPGGSSFVSGDMGGQVTIRDARTGAVRFQGPHGQYVLAVAYSPDGRQIATGSSDHSIQILDATSGQQLKKLERHTDGVLSVRFSPDGKQLLSSSYDTTARLWDVASGKELQVLRGHSWWVWAAEFSPNADRIVTAGQDGKAIVWKKGAVSPQPSAVSQSRSAAPSPQPPTPALYEQQTQFMGHDGAVYAARFSPQGNLVATGGYDKLVMLWNPDEVKPIDIAHQLDGETDQNSSFMKLAGHSGPVRAVAFSPNGELLLSGSEDNALRVWDVAKGESVKTLRGHGSGVRTCTFSPDGQWVLSGGQDERIRVWDVQGYQETRVLHSTVLRGHLDAVLSAHFSADGKQIVTASRDRTASLWDAATGERLRKFEEGHEFLVSNAVFFSDGRRLATGAGDNSVRVWDMTTGTQLTVLAPTGRIGVLAVSPDGNWLATGSPGTDAKLWDANSGEALGTLTGHVAEVSAIAFAPQGDRLASGDDRGRIRIWKRDGAGGGQWSLERELAGHSRTITAMRFTPDGQRLVSASGDRTCGQWNVTTGEELPLQLKHPDYVSSLDMSADGTLALTSCDDGIVRLWRLADAKDIASIKSPEGIVNSVGLSADAQLAVLTSFENRKVRLWKVNGGNAAATELEMLLDFGQMGGQVWSAIFAPDKKHVLTIGGNDAELWSLETRRPVVRFSPHGAVASATISPDGKLIATGSWDHSAKIWDAATGRALRKLDGGHTGYINSVEFSPDGRELLTASDDGTARLWDVASGKPSNVVLKGHTARILAASYSPDATRILTVSGDKTARVWDRATGRELMPPLAGHAWAVLSGEFSPDGKHIITGSQDNSAKIWDVATGKVVITLAGHTSAVTSVAFSPDGSRALTGSQDNTAKLWDAKTGKEILSLPGHTQEVTSVSFSPDGHNVLTASRDGTAIIWLATDWRDEKMLRTAGIFIERRP